MLHADIKPANIFLDKSQTVAKIADYGLSKCLEKNISTHTFRGGPACIHLPPALHICSYMLFTWNILCGKLVCMWPTICHMWAVEEAYGICALKHDPVRAGTVSYMCPQMLSGGAVSYFCDVFSFGVVMQEVLTGEMAEGRRAMRQPRLGHALGFSGTVVGVCVQ